jgi:hypothetical protein
MECLIITNISKLYVPFIGSSLFTFSTVLFYLDDFKLSNKKVISYLQVFSFISMSLITIYLVYYNTTLTDIMCYVKDIKDTNSDNTNINAHGNTTFNKDIGKTIGQGLSQVGLGITMAGISSAVGKAISKSSVPPLQKATVIIGASIIGGFGSSRINYFNKGNITIENTISNTNNSSSINKLIDNSIISPLQESLLYGEYMSYICLSIIYVLIIQLIFKLYFKDKINFNFFKLLSNNIISKLEFYINKIISLNKQMSFI